MAPTNTKFEDPSSTLVNAFSIVSIIIPSCATTMIPLQNPITIAANAIPFTPSINSSDICLSFKPPIIPINIPIPRNTIDNSFMYHPNLINPNTTTQSPIRKIIKTPLCLPVKISSSFLSSLEKFLLKSLSFSNVTDFSGCALILIALNIVNPIIIVIIITNCIILNIN